MSSISSVAPLSSMFRQRSTLDGIDSKEALISNLERITNLLIEGSFDLSERQVVEALVLKSFPFTTHLTPLPQLLFFVAVSLQNKSVVRTLIRAQCVDVNQKNGDGETPLQTACKETETELVEILLLADADVNLAGRDKMTPLMTAAKYGRDKTVQLLLSPPYLAAIHRTDVVGETALHLAASGDNVASVRHLLEAGADPLNFGSHPIGRSAFHIACEENKILLIGEMLSFVRQRYTPHNDEIGVATVEEEIQKLVDHRTSSGLTGLHLAVNNGHVNLCEFLLQSGANEDLVTDDEMRTTPLLGACKNDSTQIARVLIEHKKAKDPAALAAFINVENSEGETPLSLAFMNRSELFPYLLENQAKIDPAALLKAVSIRNQKEGITALHVATSLGLSTIVEALLQYMKVSAPAELAQYLEAKDGQGKSAMYKAVGRQLFSIVEILLKYGAVLPPNMASFLQQSLNTVGSQHGESGLHVAVSAGFQEIVRVLIRHFTSVSPEELDGYINFTDRQGKSAMDKAVAIEHFPIAKTLLHRGGTISPETLRFVVLERKFAWVKFLTEKFNECNECVVKDDEVKECALKETEVRLLVQDENGSEGLTRKALLPVDALDRNGHTLLNNAILGEHPVDLQILNFLLRSRYINAINTADGHGLNPLHRAAERGDLPVLQALLAVGAHVDTPTFEASGSIRRTSLHIAACANAPAIVNELLFHFKRMRPALLQRYIDERASNTGTTALFEATKRNNLAVSSIIYSYTRIIDGDSLLFAIRAGYVEHVELFMQGGAIPLPPTLEEPQKVLNKVLSDKMYFSRYDDDSIQSLDVASQAFYALVHSNEFEFGVICDKMERISFLLNGEKSDSNFFKHAKASLGESPDTSETISD